MPVKTAIFVLLFAFCAAGAVFHPLIGALGYIAHYILGPDQQWWSRPIRHLGIRYSYVLALITAVGVLLNWPRLRFGRKLLQGHEILLLLFLGVIWLSRLVGEQTQFYTIVDHPSVKFAKIVFFLLLLSHIVTTRARLDALLWTIIICTLLLGLQAYARPQVGRLETVGGADFRETNFLAAYVVAALPLIGAQFLRSGWVGKGICLLAGVFTTNALILTRSRGGMVGLAGACLMAILCAPRRLRGKIVVGVVIAGIGGLALTDPGFWNRAQTINASGEQRDASASGRIETWKASIRLLKDHPLGVGAGNFFQTIGRYDERFEGRDAHNTYVRCYSELGIQGFVLLLIIGVNSLLLTRRAARRIDLCPEDVRADLHLVAFGFYCCLAGLAVCGLTITMLYNEYFWWFLALPLCLARTIENTTATVIEEEDAAQPAVILRRPLFPKPTPKPQPGGFLAPHD